MAYRGQSRKEFQPTDPASAAQMSTLDDMLAERLVTDGMREGIEQEMAAGLVRGQASALIQYLGYCDRTPEAQAEHDKEAVTEPGEYEHDGVVYQVVRAKPPKTHMYAVNAETGEFAKGVFYRLKASEKVS
jgi:hypothetical protein